MPAPGGEPISSGWMLMSQTATSASVNGLQRPGPSASGNGVPSPRPSADAAPAATQNASPTAEKIPLCVNMLNLPRAVNAPAGDGVKVVIQHRYDRRNRLQLPTFGDEFSSGRLYVAGVVPGTALQGRDPAVPTPRHAEAGEGLAEHRLRQGRLGPAFAAIGRNHHFGDAASAGVC